MSTLSEEYSKNFSGERKKEFDRRFREDFDPSMSELSNILRILEEMQEFNCVEFNIGDIVRSGFVRNYLIQKTKLGMGLE